EWPVLGADPKRLVPIIRSRRRRAGDEPIGDGLAGAVGCREQPTGLAYSDFLESIRQREVTDRLAGFVGIEDIAEDQPRPLDAPDHIEIGVDILGTAAG